MGGLYDQLAADYHLLFPARDEQLKLLTELAGAPPARVLDAASGSGEYVAALSARGYDAYGLELDPAMHAQAGRRHPRLAKRADPHLVRGDMVQADKLLRGPFKLAVCIGNSLAHLASEAEVASTIEALWGLTRPDGAVILQLSNFERALKGGRRAPTPGEQRVSGRQPRPGFIFDLPQLSATRRDGTALRFERQYLMRRLGDVSDASRAPDKLIFRTCLSVGDQQQEAYTPLLILTWERLRYCLPRAADRVWYGGFDKSEWTEDAPATIAVLR